ncbi:acetyltransferase, GNAT family [Clostridiales bacterium oral taxon 876 str. F0540]|nr:acetyltransferase, GNAT family [Clostridiales bacterium oral taxon 876 str. F0540]
MKVELRELSLEDGRDIYDMLQKMGQGENGFENSAYGITYEEFSAYLERNHNISRGIGLSSWQVPQTMYWLVIDGKPVGIGKLRSRLTDALLRVGGHIGYGITPSERGKGYGKIMLAELLKEAKKKKIEDVLLTCNEDNIASRKVIETNGGKLENIEEYKCRYWIDNRR